MSDSPSEFHVEVVRLGPVEKHPKADTLSITKVHGGYPVIFKTGDFHEGDLAVYVPVDALVPTSRPEFAFLRKEGAERHRIRAVRLRGVFSMGLLAPISDGAGFEEGESAREYLDIDRYEPPPPKVLRLTRGQGRGPAPAWMPVYGVEGYRRYPNVLQPGELVSITEKIHGTNARYCYHDGKLYVGSHKTLRGTSRGRLVEWFNRVALRLKTALGRPHRAHLLERCGDVWWEIATKYDLKARLAACPDMVVYGEIYGDGVQDLTYGLKNGERRLVVFDVLDAKIRRWLEPRALDEFCKRLGFDQPPSIASEVAWTPALVSAAEGASLVSVEAARQIREGVVIRPVLERTSPECGRVIFKCVSESYLLRT